MFESPQYLTPGGFKRLSNNPFRKKSQELEAQENAGKSLPLKRKLLIAKPGAVQKKRPQFELSDKAAMLIAQAIKGMLKK